MSALKCVAVINAGQPDADSFASPFVLFGYGGLAISSYLHQQHGDEVKHFDILRTVHGIPRSRPLRGQYRLIQALVRHTHRTRQRNLAGYATWQNAERGKYDHSGALIAERLLSEVKQRSIDIGIATRKGSGIPNRVTQSRSHAGGTSTADHLTA